MIQRQQSRNALWQELSMRSIHYHLRAAVACCIIPGEIDDGGLAIRIPVVGLTMGIAFLVRTADG